VGLEAGVVVAEQFQGRHEEMEEYATVRVFELWLWVRPRLKVSVFLCRTQPAEPISSLAVARAAPLPPPTRSAWFRNSHDLAPDLAASQHQWTHVLLSLHTDVVVSLKSASISLIIAVPSVRSHTASKAIAATFIRIFGISKFEVGTN
jgi:hypothetical protein